MFAGDNATAAAAAPTAVTAEEVAADEGAEKRERPPIASRLRELRMRAACAASIPPIPFTPTGVTVLTPLGGGQ